VSEKEVVVCAAIKFLYKDKEIIMPSVRHCDETFWHMIDVLGIEKDCCFKEATEGFLTNTRRFVDRVEGKAIAVAANQLICDFEKKHLFSESLY
jgi:hypothetical protein